VNGFGVNTNGAGATSDGAEFALTFRPYKGWRLTANGAYNDASLDGDTSVLVGGVEGDKLPFSPKTTFGLGADYRWVVGTTMPAYAGLSLRRLSKRSGAFDSTFRLANGRQRELPSYQVVDAHVGVEMGTWTLEAYGKNLGNSDGKTSTSALMANRANLYPNGAISTGVIAPRTIGMTLTKEY